MQVGNIVQLTMEKVLKKDMEVDNTAYFAEVLSYHEEEQILLLGCKREVLVNISLDAKYSCTIEKSDCHLSCDGVVRERYENEEGSVIRFYIENGMYKVMKEEI